MRGGRAGVRVDEQEGVEIGRGGKGYNYNY